MERGHHVVHLEGAGCCPVQAPIIIVPLGIVIVNVPVRPVIVPATAIVPPW